jgi:hypothetical protein
MFKVPTASEITAKHNPSYNIWPNLVTPIADSGIPFLRALADGLRGRWKSKVIWFAPDWGGGELHPLWPKRIDNFERILYEDTQFAECTCKSPSSLPRDAGITLSYQERRIYHWHEELDRRIGVEIFRRQLRITPVLAPFVRETIGGP